MTPNGLWCQASLNTSLLKTLRNVKNVENYEVQSWMKLELFAQHQNFLLRDHMDLLFQIVISKVHYWRLLEINCPMIYQKTVHRLQCSVEFGCENSHLFRKLKVHSGLFDLINVCCTIIDNSWRLDRRFCLYK
jgi:hypothetical protein